MYLIIYTMYIVQKDSIWNTYALRYTNTIFEFIEYFKFSKWYVPTTSNFYNEIMNAYVQYIVWKIIDYINILFVDFLIGMRNNSNINKQSKIFLPTGICCCVQMLIFQSEYKLFYCCWCCFFFRKNCSENLPGNSYFGMDNRHPADCMRFLTNHWIFLDHWLSKRKMKSKLNYFKNFMICFRTVNLFLKK